MARELTDQEKEALSKAIENYEPYYAGYEIEERQGFEAGFIACLEYQQARIDELVAALERIRDTAKSWEGRSQVPYWNLGDIAAAALIKARGQ